MAETTAPELPVVPRYRFNQELTVTGTNLNGATDSIPTKTFKKYDVITGVCKKGRHRVINEASPGRVPMIEYTDETAVYLIDAKYLDPLLENDRCGYENEPGNGNGMFNFDPTTKKVITIVLIVLGAIIVLKIFKVI